jgi:hypothetical protein
VSKCSNGMWGMARTSHWHAHPEEHRSSGTWGIARAAQQGERAREYFSSGTLGTTKAAQWEACAGEQSFSSVGQNAHYRSEVWGALAHRDEASRRRGLPYKMPAEHMNFKI